VLVLFAALLLVVVPQVVPLAVLGALPVVAHLAALLAVPLVVQVGLLVALGVPLVVDLLVALAEVLVPLLGEFVMLGLVVALVMVAVGLVEDLLKCFLQQGQIQAFQRAQVQPAKQQADLELLVQGQCLQPGCFHLLVQFDDLRCQLANLELLLLHQLPRMEQFLYGFVLWMS
jgi:hypothetical protein